MAVTGRLFPQGLYRIVNQDVDLLNDDMEIALLSSSYTFDKAHDAWDDVSTYQVTGGGTTPSANLTSRALSVVNSASATAWQATTTYALGDIVRAAADNGHLYICTQAGTSGASVSFETGKLSETSDGTVLWVEFGASYLRFTSAEQTWSNSTATARYAVIWKNSGTPSTSYLVSLIDFGQDESSSNGNFTVTPPSSGWFSIGVGSA